MFGILRGGVAVFGVAFGLSRVGGAMSAFPGATAFFTVLLLIFCAFISPDLQHFAQDVGAIIMLFVLIGVASLVFAGSLAAAFFLFMGFMFFAILFEDGFNDPAVWAGITSFFKSVGVFLLRCAVMFVAVGIFAALKRCFYDPRRAQANYKKQLAAYELALTYDPAAAKISTPPPAPTSEAPHVYPVYATYVNRPMQSESPQSAPTGQDWLAQGRRDVGLA